MGRKAKAGTGTPLTAMHMDFSSWTMENYRRVLNLEV